MVTAAMELKDMCSLEEVMTNLDSMLKSRHYFANKGLSSQSYGFSSSHVWMWELTIKKGEGRRLDAFELWCWRRLLRVPWTARRSSQSILEEISPEYSLKGLMLKLKLQYFGLMQRDNSLEKTLMLGKTEAREGDNRGWDGWMASSTQWTWVLEAPGDGEGQGSLVCYILHEVANSQTWLSNWTTATQHIIPYKYSI